jgi:hypothetical protein
MSALNAKTLILEDINNVGLLLLSNQIKKRKKKNKY